MSGAAGLYGGTDMSEGALERDIVADMTSPPGGWIEGSAKSYDRGRAIDVEQLRAFLEEAQPEAAAAFELGNPQSETRAQFLNRVQGYITQHGVVDLLRKGMNHSTSTGAYEIVFYGATPSPGNVVAERRHRSNRWSVTRQLRYSQDDTQRALDLVIFVNGLPLATFELKNHQTKQTVEEAIEQYKNTRDARELLFADGRCLAHFAVDEHSVRFCTRLADKKSWFLPFDKGRDGGAGNPPNPHGYRTAYLWQDILSPASLADIIEHYAARLVEKDPTTKKTKRWQIFPRYHQLDVVRELLKDSEENGAGQRYLIQHSAGSGKSNSIAWLAHQLIGLGGDASPVFDAVIVVTDRINLDTQIERTVKQFTQRRSLVKHADKSKDLREALANDTKIIISTVQKFPVILEDIDNAHRDRQFAIIIDEAHSGQGGKTTHAMSGTLGATSVDIEEEETTEDKINKIIDRQKLLDNASYYAFTATPKPRTFGYFGRRGEDGKDHPFHVYTMKQAIEERFILDVLKNYTTVESYYKLVKSVEDDPEFDAKKAAKKLRRYVEGNSHAIQSKASIMVDHLLDKVIRPRKIGGKARAMVVADGILRALDYYFAINTYLEKLGSPYRAIIAFSGEHEYSGKKVTEASLNGFPSSAIERTFREDPYRILVCADKFQTGYDEPLLHTMYVDKPLSGVRAVQTLSRLNRAHPNKHDVAVLDFYNKTEIIRKSFEQWYRTTVLAGSVDPNKLHDLRAVLDGAGVYGREDIDQFVEMFLDKEPRSRLEAFLDQLVIAYQELDSEDQQVEFKGRAKAFVRTYDYLAGILPYRNPEWLKLSILLTFLTPKLPAPIEEDLSRGILETVDLDSYRAEQQTAISIALSNEDAELTASAPMGMGQRSEPELKPASVILQDFNQHFGNIPWTDKDRIRHLITVEIPAKVREDKQYINAQRYNDEQNARVESDAAVQRAIMAFLKSDTELYSQFAGNPAFKRWLTEMVFRETYDPTAGGDESLDAQRDI
ncbi:type I restriction endonuclease subunit R [Streptosporangium sp. NPDC087985]|uniref:type I restriction endonuclease subunit R n=1 Tax=Streptosporangium sp. NPDC087985 TaxID=3366196 RepID=UPI003826165D